MSGTQDPGEGRPRIDAAAKAAFIKAMREGKPLGEAAAAHGVTVQAFRKARKRDPAFDAEWREAHAASAEAERDRSPRGCPSTALRAVPLPERSSGRNERASSSVLPERSSGRNEGEGEWRIVPGNRRRLQRRKLRHVRFDEERQQRFLAHFAWSCDTMAAAAAAGVCERTVYNHRRRYPAFAALFQEALDQGYARLEAEALRQRLVLQRKLRAAIDKARPEDAAIVPADVAAEFERVMKLLARWDRKGRSPEQPAAANGRRVWTFDAAIELLAERLTALGVEVEPLPAEEAALYDGPEADERGDGEAM